MTVGKEKGLTSGRNKATLAAMQPFMTFLSESAWSRRVPDHPDTCDFVFGNPHEMPLGEFVTALERNVRPLNREWFAYKTSEPESKRIVAESLNQRRSVRFEADDVFMTNGAFAALSVSLATLIDPGDEVIFISPPWFFYESMIVGNGGTPVRVGIDARTLDLDVGAIEEAISERTRAIIVNSPNNPTGKIYPRETLERLGEVLETAGSKYGRPIFLLSDESYSRIVFDDRDDPSPTEHYPYSLLIYTYGKILLTPGQRIGYIAVPSHMPGREELRSALLASQVVTGFAFPNALLQHSLADLENLTIDVEHLQRKRDRLTEALVGMGYRVNVPEGTFYLMVDSPLADDLEFCERLAEHRVYALPGSIYEMPGTFRLSLTANEEMIEKSLAGFEQAIRGVATGVAVTGDD